jgi:ribosomal protein L37AE/L43A
MDVFSDNFTPKNAKIFECQVCDFRCSKKSDWNRHIMTAKHKKRAFSDTNDVFSDIKNAHVCPNCEKKFYSRNGLWVHKKKCNVYDEEEYKESNNHNINETILNKILSKDDLIIKLLEQNEELQKSLIEMSKEKTITNSNNK